MHQTVTITATMADGSIIVERTDDFGQYAGMVLGFRRDPDVCRVRWHVTEDDPEPPAQARLRRNADRLATTVRAAYTGEE